MDMSKEMDELRSKAEIIAEATGRTPEAVLEDLLDDGIVNLSNEDSKDKDLVAQLKEAAELIATVQNISAEVSANTVLNGGDNSTEVKVETTLEGDIVDRALESVQRKAEKLKMIIAIVAPILLLLSGGVGLDYFMDNNDNSESPDSSESGYGGCMAVDADNYDSMASWDDGSCYWDNNNNGGGGGPPDCNSDWRWDAVVIRDFDSNGEGFNDDLQIQMTFNDWNKCNLHMEGYFTVEIWDETRGFMWDQYQINNNFHDQYTVDDNHYDLDAGNYVVRVDYHFAESFWEGPSALITIESEDEPIGCDANLINEQAYLLEEDSENDAVRISADVSIVPEQDNCEDRDFSILWQLYQDNTVKYEHTTWEEGESSDPDGADYVYHTWDNVEIGNYSPKVSLFLDGDKLDEKLIAHTISIQGVIQGCTDSEATNYNPEAQNDDGSCEYPPENCEINLYGIQYYSNNTDVTVAYDLDCGYGSETGGYNVSVQLSVSPNGSFDLLDYDVGYHYIEGYIEDIYFLTLSNFTVSNITNYDIKWIALWGESEYIERDWLNQPFTHPEPEPEPEPCENLTLVSNGITLDKNSTNLTLDWKLNHDGPDDISCFVELEVSVTLYQNGTFYDVSDFSKNGVHKIYANETTCLYLDASDVDIFADLPSGTYEVLVKYRIIGETQASQDYFANSVVIS